jgi:SHS2 domain-containing protein
MFEFFDHTADLGIRVFAPDRETLFADAARGLVAASVENPESIQPTIVHAIAIRGTEIDLLLFDWLNELLFRFEADGFIASQFQVTFTDSGLSATVRGEPFDSARHELTREVKAVTYHGLFVRPTGDGWHAEFIVDI